MTYLPPDPIEKYKNKNYGILYRLLRRLRMNDPGLVITKLLFTSLLLTTILYTIPAVILTLNDVPLKYTFIAANSYVFLQIPIFSKYTKKEVASGWLIALPIVLSTSFLAYFLYDYPKITIFAFVICMCMPIILPKFLPTKGNIIGVSIMNAYLNAMLNAPLLKEHTKYLYIAHASSIITILLIALVSYIVVSSPLTKIVAVRKSLGAIAQGFSQLYISDNLPISVKTKKAKKLASYFHNCAISIDAVLKAAPPLPEGLAHTYHRAVFDEDQAISTLTDNIGNEISYFQERYYWNEFCKCRVIQNKIGFEMDQYIYETSNSFFITKFLPERFIVNNKNIFTNEKYSDIFKEKTINICEYKNDLNVEAFSNENDIKNINMSCTNKSDTNFVDMDMFENISTFNGGNYSNIEKENVNKIDFNIDINYTDLKAIPTIAIADSTAKTNPFSKLTFDLRTRNFIQGLVAITLSSLVGYFINDRYFYFASLGAYALLLGSSTTADKWRKMKKRVLGTVLGACVGIISYWAVTNLPEKHLYYFFIENKVKFLPIIVLLILFASLAVSLIRVDYLYCVIFITATIVQTYNILHAPLYILMFDRIIETTLGAGIGVVVANIIFPVNSRKALNRGLSIFSVKLRKEINALKQVWINDIYDENSTQIARQTENINEGLTELSNIMVKTPWGKDSRNQMSIIISILNSLVAYMNNAVSHTVFMYEIKRKLPEISDIQKEALKKTFHALDVGSQLLGLEYSQRNKHIWPDYKKIAKELDDAFDGYAMLDSSITVSRTQPNDWYVQYFFARELSLALNRMYILHSRILKISF